MIICLREVDIVVS